MKAGLILTMLTLVMAQRPMAQRECASFAYGKEQLRKNPSLASNLEAIEKFTQQHPGNIIAGRIENNVIRIPVVVHILYHTTSEKVTDEQVKAQLAMLNKCFRRQNADTVNTPAVFKPLAADCEIEFQLATSDPRMRNTNGIIRKYTPVTKWTNDDKMKFSSEMGDDAWDTKNYLNIWVCRLDKFAGYSSFPGAEENVDGLVLGLQVASDPSNKTIAHEVGHWLNLKHIWGDDYCGDDGVSDTPKQASYTPGCPTTIRITCGNGPNGDMYMNYMDFTEDACTNMFTQGQKARMRALFLPGGARYAILSSKGLNPPLIYEIPLPEEDPKWLEPRFYPNPATNEINIDLSYDVRWIGKVFQVTNLQGQTMMTVVVTSRLQKINISHLAPGMYFLAAKKEDGVSIKQKFIKL
jgi:Pregnancy-associated plasma protein-A/Secretion system C-terminal sorting domain